MRRAWAPLSGRTGRWLLLLTLAGCDDSLLGDPRGGGDGPVGEGFCAVRDLFDSHCVGCHAAGGLGGLDLSTDPIAATVEVASTVDPATARIAPGSPNTSLLFLKIDHSQATHQGGAMPPGPMLDAASIEAVRAWITDGASAECATTGQTDPPDGLYPHPQGWAEPGSHGLHAKLQDLECATCHAPDLKGDATLGSPSCDSCHAEGWRTNCVFCHGGEVDDSGAPPRDIDGATSDLVFPAHQEHVHETSLHVAWDCQPCHAKPVDVLTPGHVFIGDDTPGAAEVDLRQGLSNLGSFSASTGTCSSLYCHGNGRGDNGTISVDAAPMRCASCHPDRTSGRSAWELMSGAHEDHLREAVGCHECHGATTANSTSILDNTLHINGSVQLALATGMTRSGATCSGTCHGTEHEGELWTD